MILNKNKKNQTERLIGGLLDSQDADVLVVRKNTCDVLFMNDKARDRIDGILDSGRNCLNGYSGFFPHICRQCINKQAKPAQEGDEKDRFLFDVRDIKGRLFEVRGNTLEWVDGKPATLLMIRDVDEERQTQKRLYDLAYIDHLTGVPNRQKLKEDCEELLTQVAAGEKSGVLALFDLDNFKIINDTYGHNTGDVMLRRLTEHLSADKVFAGHLYRLGGDEFVMLFSNAESDFDGAGPLRAHYEKLLAGALRSYSMPNIEHTCTISMGIALFPLHGTSYSELLRKADIALYQAKNQGRNRLAIFEDEYDKAKKFKDLYVNVQPILTGQGTTYGYELIDRGEESGEDNALNLRDINRSMEVLDLGAMEDKSRYFINYSSHLLDETVVKNLPKEKFVIQLHLEEGCAPEDLENYRHLRSLGYSVALSNLSDANISPELLGLAEFIKFKKGVLGRGEQKRIIQKYPGKKFIAENVNTTDAFDAAKGDGFILYQGFFFEQQVEVKKTKEIDPMKVNYLRLLKLTSADGYVNFKEISSIISSDVALSYKLLRLLNSAAVGLRNKISSIDMAVAYLGEDSLKQWIALLALRGVAADKPLELVRMSLIRAHFGELLAPRMKPRRDTNHIFLLGLFSLLHIALEKTKEELFSEIPVADDIRQSLLTDVGPYSDVVAFYRNYEYANWDEVNQFARKNQLNDWDINDAYFSSLKWYNELEDSE